MEPPALAPLPFRTSAPQAHRLYRARSAADALGLAVAHLMGKPAFARQPFGVWSRVLVGTVNRGHYQFVLDPDNRVAGFLGWAFVSEAQADAWLHGRAVDGTASVSGDCIVFNAWSADSPAANRLLVSAARAEAHGCRIFYAKRFYPSGSVRPIKMPVGRTVAAGPVAP